jgi:hypothetical protein
MIVNSVSRLEGWKDEGGWEVLALGSYASLIYRSLWVK